MMNLIMRWNNKNRINAQVTFTKFKNKYNIIIRKNLILSNKIKEKRLTCYFYYIQIKMCFYKIDLCFYCTLQVMDSTTYVYVVIDEAQKQSIVCMRKKNVASYNFRLIEFHVSMSWRYWVTLISMYNPTAQFITQRKTSWNLWIVNYFTFWWNGVSHSKRGVRYHSTPTNLETQTR